MARFMKKSKVIQFLSSFDSRELQRLDKYIHSPYFNSHRDTIRLFDYLKKQYPEFAEKKVDKQVVFKKVFPSTPFDTDKLHHVNSYLHKQILDFMRQEGIQENWAFQYEHLSLIKVLQAKGLEQQATGFLAIAQREHQKSPFKDEAYFHEMYALSLELINHRLSQNSRHTDAGFQQLSDSLDYFFVIGKLRLAVAIANRQLIVSETSQVQLLEEVLELYHSRSFEAAPIVELLFSTYKMATEEEGNHWFEQLQTRLSQQLDKISKSDANQLYSYALNHCARQYKQGKLPFLEKMFELYQAMLQAGLLFYEPAQINIAFKNVITLGLKLKKYEWTEAFIQDYSHHLPDQYQKGVMSYNLANLYFTQGNFQKALKELISVEFLDPFYRLNYDMLLLKIYYECGEIESLLSRCDAFIHYIRRNKSLSNQNRTAYSNFAKFTRRLARLKYENRGNIEKIVAALEASPLLVERSWLAEKVKLESFGKNKKHS